MPVGTPLVVIAGMHRSGTSLLTQCLAEAGLFVGRPDHLMPANAESNAAGHWELLALARLNDDILAAVGAHWAGPTMVPSEAIVGLATGDLGDRARAMLDHELSAVEVAKDPRFSVTLPFWRTILGDDLVVVVPWRHPVEVARSLERRNGLPPEFGLLLWDEYHRRLVAAARGLPRIVIGQQDLVTDTPAQVQWILPALAIHGVRLPADSERSRFEADEAIVHHAVDTPLDSSDRALLDALATDGNLPPSPPDDRDLLFRVVAPLANDRDQLRWRLHRLRRAAADDESGR